MPPKANNNNNNNDVPNQQRQNQSQEQQQQPFLGYFSYSFPRRNDNIIANDQMNNNNNNNNTNRTYFSAVINRMNPLPRPRGADPGIFETNFNYYGNNNNNNNNNNRMPNNNPNNTSNTTTTINNKKKTPPLPKFVSRPFRPRTEATLFNHPLLHPGAENNASNNTLFGSNVGFYDAYQQDRIRRDFLRDSSSMITFDTNEKDQLRSEFYSSSSRSSKKEDDQEQQQQQRHPVVAIQQSNPDMKPFLESMGVESNDDQQKDISRRHSSSKIQRAFLRKCKNLREKLGKKKARLYLDRARTIAIKKARGDTNHDHNRNSKMVKKTRNNQSAEKEKEEENKQQQDSSSNQDDDDDEVNDLVDALLDEDVESSADDETTIPSLDQVLVEFHVGGIIHQQQYEPNTSAHNNEKIIVTTWATVQGLLESACGMKSPCDYFQKLKSIEQQQQQQENVDEDRAISSSSYSAIIPFSFGEQQQQENEDASSSSSSSNYRFLVDRDLENFRILILALRRAQQMKKDQQHKRAALLRNRNADPHHQQQSNYFAPSRRFVPLNSSEQFRLLEEATYFKIVPSIWRSISDLQYQVPDRKAATSFVRAGQCVESNAVCSESMSVVVSPFCGATIHDWQNTPGAATADEGHFGGQVDVIEVPIAIEECEHVGIGVISRSAAQNLDQEFSHKKDCSVLFHSGVFHSNFFDRVRRFDTDAAFGPGDVVTVRIDFRSRIITWRRSGVLMLVERFSSPGDFIEADDYRDFLMGQYLNEEIERKKQEGKFSEAFEHADDAFMNSDDESDDDNDDEGRFKNITEQEEKFLAARHRHYYIKSAFDNESRADHLRYCRRIAARMKPHPRMMNNVMTPLQQDDDGTGNNKNKNTTNTTGNTKKIIINIPSRPHPAITDSLAVAVILRGKSKIRIANYSGATSHEGPKWVDMNTHEDYLNMFLDLASNTEMAPSKEELARNSISHNGIGRISRFGNGNVGGTRDADRLRMCRDKLRRQAHSGLLPPTFNTSRELGKLKAQEILDSISRNVRTNLMPIRTLVGETIMTTDETTPTSAAVSTSTTDQNSSLNNPTTTTTTRRATLVSPAFFSQDPSIRDPEVFTTAQASSGSSNNFKKPPLQQQQVPRNTDGIISTYCKPLKLFSYIHNRHPHHIAHRSLSGATNPFAGRTIINVITPDTVLGHPSLNCVNAENLIRNGLELYDLESLNEKQKAKVAALGRKDLSCLNWKAFRKVALASTLVKRNHQSMKNSNNSNNTSDIMSSNDDDNNEDDDASPERENNSQNHNNNNNNNADFDVVAEGTRMFERLMRD